MFLQFPACGGEKKLQMWYSHLAPYLEEAFFVGFLSWSVSTGQWSLTIFLSCSSHTKIIFRLPKEARFPNLWGRCWSDQRRTRWPSERPELGMNNHSEKGNQNNHQSAQSSKKPGSWLQKFKHKSTATLNLLLSNTDSTSGLKRTTVKLKRETCQAPVCPGTGRAPEAAGGKAAADVDRGTQAVAPRKKQFCPCSLSAHFRHPPIHYPHTVWAHFVGDLDAIYAYKLNSSLGPFKNVRMSSVIAPRLRHLWWICHLPKERSLPSSDPQSFKNNRRCEWQEGHSARRTICMCPFLVLISNWGKHRHSLRSRSLSPLPCSHDPVGEKTVGSGVLWVCGLATKGRPLGHFSAGAGCLFTLDISMGAGRGYTPP